MNPANEALRERLFRAQIGGCTCLTKTPEIKFHHELCHFRLFVEALTALAEPGPDSVLVPLEFRRALYIVSMELMQSVRAASLDDETRAAVALGVRLGIEDAAVMFGRAAAQKRLAGTAVIRRLPMTQPTSKPKVIYIGFDKNMEKRIFNARANAERHILGEIEVYEYKKTLRKDNSPSELSMGDVT